MSTTSYEAQIVPSSVQLGDDEAVEISLAVRGKAVGTVFIPSHDLRTIDMVKVMLIGELADGRRWTVAGHGTPIWSTLEDIAAFVAGDGTDPQRVALADGIREHRYRQPSAQEDAHPPMIGEPPA